MNSSHNDCIFIQAPTVPSFLLPADPAGAQAGAAAAGGAATRASAADAGDADAAAATLNQAIPKKGSQAKKGQSLISNLKPPALPAGSATNPTAKVAQARAKATAEAAAAAAAATATAAAAGAGAAGDVSTPPAKGKGAAKRPAKSPKTIRYNSKVIKCNL